MQEKKLTKYLLIEMEAEQDLKILQPTNNSDNINQKPVVPILWYYILRVLTHLGSSKDVTLKRRK